jgi:glycogen synthase
MRMLLTADTAGGVWTYALELADALHERDVEVVLAVMGDEPTPAQRAELAEANVSHAFEPYALEWMPGAWDQVEAAGRWLLELRDQVEPDLVHLNGYAHASLPWGVPIVVTGHSCVLSWFEAVRGHRAPREWNRYRDAVRSGLRAADVLVAPTRAMLEALVRLYAPRCATRVVPNGRRAPLGPLPPKEPLVFSAGRLWDAAKNVAALARVAPALEWPVAVAGAGSIEPTVHALGLLPRRELDGWFARASIFALPARYEPFGLGALEAGLTGCALVLGDIASLREVWGDAAVFVDPNDDAALTEALRRLIHDESLRAELAARARARAEMYTVDAMADGYLAVYGTAVAAARENAA